MSRRTIGRARSWSASAHPDSATTSCWRSCSAAARADDDALALANRLLERADGCMGLRAPGVGDLRHVAGVGRARAAQVLAAVELGRRTLRARHVGSPAAADAAPARRAICCRSTASRAVEQFGIVMLDTKHRVIRIKVLSVGSLDRPSSIRARCSARRRPRRPPPSCCFTTIRPAIRRRAPTTWR